MKIIKPSTTSDFEKYYRLRWEVLRKPWNQPLGSEKDSMEEQSIHALMLDENEEAVAVCRLQFNSSKVGQIRFMAVEESSQGKGLGKEILNYLENKAKEQGIKFIVLDARENAINFYLSMGYELKEKAHLLYGEIQHYKMEKSLN
jgi:N-acetylglutamate synthase-like GNAT family acetyltransferase